MATASSDKPITFSADSIETRDRIRDFVSRRLRELAIARARDEGREQVTGKDILDSLDQVVREAIQQNILTETE
ncbi:MAG TPA: hypothetical protein VND64_24305 [Pirellulales bacterium]|nr:hypothetical protein [Pirellulales bacterium]